MVDRVERIGVAVRTAQELYTRGGTADLRVALILIDSAAELVLQGAVADRGWWLRTAELWSTTAPERTRTISLPSEITMSALGDEPWRLRAADKKKLAWEFVVKLDFLVFLEELDRDYAFAIRRLHKYRGDTYHKDQVREATLRSSVLIYFYLLGILLRDLSPTMSRMAHRGEAERVAARLNIPVELAESGHSAQEALAESLLADTDLLSANIVQTLAENSVDRLDVMDEDLDYIEEFMNGGPSSGARREDIMRIAQSEEPLLTREQLRGRSFPVTAESFVAWRSQARSIGTHAGPLSAFHAYAELESAMQPFERQLHDLLVGVDREIQHQIDVARGK